jgi:hypothetical protein
VSHLLLADQHVYVWGSRDALVGRLVWARGRGYTTAKARRCSAFTDRPLMACEPAELVEAATKVALAGEQVAVGNQGEGSDDLDRLVDAAVLLLTLGPVEWLSSEVEARVIERQRLDVREPPSGRGHAATRRARRSIPRERSAAT